MALNYAPAQVYSQPPRCCLLHISFSCCNYYVALAQITPAVCQVDTSSAPTETTTGCCVKYVCLKSTLTNMKVLMMIFFLNKFDQTSSLDSTPLNKLLTRYLQNKSKSSIFYTECKYHDKVSLLFFQIRAGFFFPQTSTRQTNAPSDHDCCAEQTSRLSEPQHQKQTLGSSLSVPLCPKRCLTNEMQFINTRRKENIWQSIADLLG